MVLIFSREVSLCNSNFPFLLIQTRYGIERWGEESNNIGLENQWIVDIMKVMEINNKQ